MIHETWLVAGHCCLAVCISVDHSPKGLNYIVIRNICCILYHTCVTILVLRIDWKLNKLSFTYEQFHLKQGVIYCALSCWKGWKWHMCLLWRNIFETRESVALIADEDSFIFKTKVLVLYTVEDFWKLTVAWVFLSDQTFETLKIGFSEFFICVHFPRYSV